MTGDSHHPTEDLLRNWFQAHRDKYDEPARYDFEEAALSGDEHTAIGDEGDQHARGYASYFFTGRALALLKDRSGD